MALDRNDYKYLDMKFDDIHKDIGIVHEKCNRLSETVAAHHAAPCHDSQRGWTLKAWGLFGTILTIVVTLLLFLERYLGGPK